MYVSGSFISSTVEGTVVKFGGRNTNHKKNSCNSKNTFTRVLDQLFLTSSVGFQKSEYFLEDFAIVGIKSFFCMFCLFFFSELVYQMSDVEKRISCQLLWPFSHSCSTRKLLKKSLGHFAWGRTVLTISVFHIHTCHRYLVVDSYTKLSVGSVSCWSLAWSLYCRAQWLFLSCGTHQRFLSLHCVTWRRSELIIFKVRSF